jgi:hypothetical protein
VIAILLAVVLATPKERGFPMGSGAISATA